MTSTPKTIKLDRFLKWVGAVNTGGEAKILIQYGEVSVNGEEETRRGRKLVAGDVVAVQGESYTVAWQGDRLEINGGELGDEPLA